MTYGKTLKYIRTRKGYTQKQVAADIVTDSFIAKFEKGNTHISFDLLIKILDRMCVSLDEFIELDKSNKIIPTLYITECVERIEKIVELNDLNQANELYEDIKDFSSPLCNMMRYILEYTFFNNLKSIKSIKEIIFEWDYVGHAEMILFNISLNIIDSDFILNTLQRIMKIYIRNNISNFHYYDDINKIFVTTIKILLYEKKESSVKLILENILLNFDYNFLYKLNESLNDYDKIMINQILGYSLFKKKTILSI